MKIKIDLEHCYGIKRLNAEFNFDAKNNIQLIYAGNGVMKSSLAKTFRSFSLNQKPVDIFFLKEYQIVQLEMRLITILIEIAY